MIRALVFLFCFLLHCSAVRGQYSIGVGVGGARLHDVLQSESSVLNAVQLDASWHISSVFSLTTGVSYVSNQAHRRTVTNLIFGSSIDSQDPGPSELSHDPITSFKNNLTALNIGVGVRKEIIKDIALVLQVGIGVAHTKTYLDRLDANGDRYEGRALSSVDNDLNTLLEDRDGVYESEVKSRFNMVEFLSLSTGVEAKLRDRLWLTFLYDSRLFRNGLVHPELGDSKYILGGKDMISMVRVGVRFQLGSN